MTGPPARGCQTCPRGKRLAVLVGMSLSCLGCVVEVSLVPARGAGTDTEREREGQFLNEETRAST